MKVIDISIRNVTGGGKSMCMDYHAAENFQYRKGTINPGNATGSKNGFYNQSFVMVKRVEYILNILK